MPRYPNQLKMTPFYGFFVGIVADWHQMLFRGVVVGTENIPGHGPFLIAANHTSHLDPPFIGCHIPRQLRFFARKSLWKSKPLGWWLDMIESIAVDRDTGDVGAIRKVLQALHENRGIVLFPEGTRSPDGRLQTPKPGVGLMACKTGAPVIPCRIFGSYEAFGKNTRFPHFGYPISIVYGPAITAAEYDAPEAGKARYQIASERIFERIAALQLPDFPVI